MQSPNSSFSHSLTASGFARALVWAAVLQIVDSLLLRIPLFPWMRLGLSHLVLLPFLLRYGTSATLYLFGFRNILSLIFGALPASSWLISTVSGLSSLSLLGPICFFLVKRNILGWLGAGMLLSSGFNLAQLYTVEKLLIGHSGFYYQIPPLLAWSLLSGMFTSFLAYRGRTQLFSAWENQSPNSLALRDTTQSHLTNTLDVSPGLYGRIKVLLAVLLLFFLLPGLAWQLSLGAACLAFCLSVRQNLRLLRYTWPWLIFLALLHLFDTPGRSIQGTWITWEGLQSFIVHASRTLAIVWSSQIWLAPLAKHLIARLSRKSGNDELGSSRVLHHNRQGNSERTARFPLFELAFSGFLLASPKFPTLFSEALLAGKEISAHLFHRRWTQLLEPLQSRF